MDKKEFERIIKAIKRGNDKVYWDKEKQKYCFKEIKDESKD